MRLIRRISAWLIGAVFLVSALSKLSDPVGTGLIVESYCRFLHIGFLIPVAKILGELLSLTEMTVAVALLTGFRRVVFAWITLALLIFFTIISTLLLIFNPDMDCGCFGQLIHLTHEQTFFKNVILLVIAIPSFVPMRDLQIMGERKLAFYVAVTMIFLLSVHSYMTIPVVETTDFKLSNTIVRDEGGLRDRDNVVLTVWDEYGNDCSEIILRDKSVLVSVYDTDDLSERRIRYISRFIQDAQNAGFQTFLLSATALDVPGMETFFADYRILKTLNRSNGGTTFTDEGYIFRKYSSLRYPSFDELDFLYNEDSTEIYAKTATKQMLALQFYVIALIAVLLLV